MPVPDTRSVLGVDIGTTSTKAIVYDADGVEHGAATAEHELLQPAAGEVVQDPLAVARETLAAIRAALAASDVAVAGLSFSSVMHSLIGLDEHGAPMTPMLTWADTRAADQAHRLRATRPELHARTGTPLHPMAPLPKLAWFAEMRPRLFHRVRRWVGIKELILHQLTGRWVIDASCASGTGLMALATLRWDDEALTAAGIRPDQLSRIVPANETLELTSPELGLAPGTPLVVGAGDGPLANLGVGAVRPGVAACSIGTSGALRLIVEQAGIDPAQRLFCYALTPGRWAVGGAVNNGGSALEWTGRTLAGELGPHAETALLEEARNVPPGSAGLIMLPYLLSERAPHWDALARGAYIGLRHVHGRPHLVRAAIEGVCQQLALVLASMRDAGNEVREIRATGGFARSELWRQILTDVFGMRVGFTAGHEGSALGAALIAMQALGIVESIDQALHLVRIEETREPDPQAAAIYAEMRPLFAELSEDLTPAFHALARFERHPEA